MDLLYRRSLILTCWSGAVLIFATQWFLYDAALGHADPFRYYLGWSGYIWGILTPAVVMFAYRNPITTATWKRSLPLHLGVCLMLVVGAISMEAMLGKLRTHQTLSVADILRHYFTRHAQVSLFTYWLLAGSIWLYQKRNDARDRESRSAALQAELATAQLAVLRAQLHPHFLFNTLQAATALIHEDPDGAEDVLLRLSEFLRVSLEEVDIQEVSLNRELEVLELYVGIQVRRFGDRLSFEVSMDDGIGDCAVPSLILQPLVENAICHGIGKRKGKDTVSIKGYKEGDYLRLEVRNLTSRLEANPVQFQDGVGLANTRSRLEHLYGDSQKLCLTNLEPEGVSAEVSIPFRPMALRDKHE